MRGRRIVRLSFLTGLVILGLLAIFALQASGKDFLGFFVPVTGPAKIAKEEAVKKAQDALKAVGVTPAAMTADLIEENPGGLTLWQVKAGEDYEMWIDAANGEKKFFLAHKKAAVPAGKRGAADEKLPAGKAYSIAKGQALKMGFSLPDNQPDEIQLVDDLDILRIKWVRKEGGYKYHDDWILLGVDPYTGELLGYHKNHFSNKPVSLTVKVEKGQAAEIAGKFAETIGFKLDGIREELMLVNPNYRWTKEVKKMPSPDVRLAWVFSMQKTEGEGEIWIDAVTGEVLGGEESH